MFGYAYQFVLAIAFIRLSVTLLLMAVLEMACMMQMSETRLMELADVVDVFLVLESNFTDSGDSKPLRLRDRLLNEQMGTPLGIIIIIITVARTPRKYQKVITKWN